MDPGFLCLGGVELANRNRVMTYIRNLGMPLLQSVPADTDGCQCPAWGPADPCTLSARAGVEAVLPELSCGGIYELTGAGSRFYVVSGVYAYDEAPVGRPPLPPLTDPGWVFGDATEVTIADIDNAPNGCYPYGIGGTDPFPGAGFTLLMFTDAVTGATATVVIYNDFTNAVQGDLAGGGVSFDLGETWQEGIVEHTWSNLACSTTPGYFTGRATFDVREGAMCNAIYGVSGLVGPATVLVKFKADATPTVGEYPDDDDPGWSIAASDLTELPLIQTQCVPAGLLPEDGLPPTGYYHVTFTDALGRSFVARAVNDYAAQAAGGWGATAYSFDGSTWNVPNPVGTTQIEWTMGELTTEFTTPTLDIAPWYDPARPESADVLGFYITELIVAPTYTRQMRARQHGGSLGAARFGPREVQVTGWCYTRSERATAYAKTWLFEALVAGSCNGDCGLPDLVGYRTCCGDDTVGELRTIKRVGLVSPPKTDLEPKFPKRAGFKFEYTLSAEVPHVFLSPEFVAGGLLMDPDGEPECNICAPCAAPGPSVCTCGNLAAPQRIVTRDDSDDAWCQPAIVRRRYIPVSATEGWDTAAAIIAITAGTVAATSGWEGLKNLRIVAFQNPLGLTGPELVDGEDVIDYADYFACQEPCMSIEVACLPAGAELVIDAAARTAQMTCGNITGSALPYLSSRGGSAFRWPEFDCSGLMIVVEADEYNTAPDSTVQVHALAQERA